MSGLLYGRRLHGGMSMDKRSSIDVLGGGLMGSGIAALFAAAGHCVRLHEPHAPARDQLSARIAEALAVLSADDAVSRIQLVASLQEAAQAEFVVEAAPEDIALKRAIFAELVAVAPRHTILARNTSVIPIGAIARGLPTAERIVGTHFWNPPHLIPLVEVVQADATSLDTVEASMRLLTGAGKRPAHVRKDVPGFIANRPQHAMWREAIAMLADGVCDARTLDECVKSSFGLRLSVLGPLENADLVGLDLTLAIHLTIMPELDRHDGPHPFLADHVARGELGCKTGQGFRDWTPAEVSALRTDLTNHLKTALAARSGRSTP
jgi:3-hydroxybutyryl-CoA dehydrogenase